MFKNFYKAIKRFDPRTWSSMRVLNLISMPGPSDYIDNNDFQSGNPSNETETSFSVTKH